MPRTHPPYPPEFKAEAVRLARSGASRSRRWRRTWASRPRRCALAAPGGRGQRQGPPGDLTTDEREELRRLRRENPRPRAGARDPEKSGGLLREGDLMSRYRFIHAERPSIRSTLLCRVLRVARSAYYAWARRGVSARAQADAASPRRSRRRTRGAARHMARRGSTPSCGRRAALRPQAGGPADARGGAGRLPPAAAGAHDRRRPGACARPEPGRARLRGAGSRPPLARRHHLSCRRRRAGATSRSCWTPTPAAWSAGRWPTTCAPSWPWTRSLWRSGPAGPPRASSTTPIAGASTRRRLPGGPRRAVTSSAR